jgi:hypothetical protein
MAAAHQRPRPAKCKAVKIFERNEARAAGKFGKPISAEVNRGKALGLYVNC